MTAEELMTQDFGTLAELIAAQGRERPGHLALVDGERTLDYAGLNQLMDQIAAALQRDGVAPRDAVAICATSSLEYAAVFMGALRAGAAAAPLAPSSSPESLVMMLKDCGSRLFFVDKAVAQALAGVAGDISARLIALDGSDVGQPFEDWLAEAGAQPASVMVDPNDPFNIIYSSGTTGAPKGIVQPHAMRWGQVRRGIYSVDSVTMISTPLYSNTTLVSFLPTLGNGGTAVLMPQFDAQAFLKL
ncbi:MAG TPA: class I adenylate-forming enzyme family protein, partial [Phenylobacterium sp.]|nr:class I adenylate-forming enzyme family protein [Phenylobacterium sp.]